MKSLLERFEVKYIPEPNTGCWLWLGTYMGAGYGQWQTGGVKKYSHRWAYEIYVGPIPDGQVVCHRCDNPACVNPAHLFVGSMRDNSLDMFRKGRCALTRNTRKGSKHGRSKLTEDQIANMRRLHASGMPYRDMAKTFSVSVSLVGKIVTGTIWTHVGAS